MCTERKATGLFVLTSFLCDNESYCVLFVDDVTEIDVYSQ